MSRHNYTTPVNNTDWIIVEEDTINVEDETVVTEHITIEDCIDLDTVDKLVQLLQDLIAELNYAAASNTQLGVERLCGNLQEMEISGCWLFFGDHHLFDLQAVKYESTK